jgi:hypothetical protein
MNTNSLDEQIKALEAQLAPEPTAAEQEEREKRERVAGLRRKVRAQRIEQALQGARAAAGGLYLVDAVDLDERAELDESIVSWFVVRGSTRKETKSFEEATAEVKLDADSGRSKLLALTKACVVHPKLDSPSSVLAFEDAVNNRFGMGLNTLVERILRLGGHRAASERAFR